MVTYEDRPVTRTWVTCENCGHSEVLQTSGYWGVLCDVCDKEGCKKCLSHNTFFEGYREYHRHNECKWTGKLLKLQKRYENEIATMCGRAIAESRPDHIC